MRVGSIVECIDNGKYTLVIKPEKAPATYTVREIIPKDTRRLMMPYFIVFDMDSIYLEEIKNVDVTPGFEFPYAMVDFRELLPPMENIEETINENVIEIQEIEPV